MLGPDGFCPGPTDKEGPVSNQVVMSNLVQMSCMTLAHCPVLTYWTDATRTLILESISWAKIHPAPKKAL